MKLYLTEIIKEANALGFGAPGQGGNSADVAFAATSPSPMAKPMAATPMSNQAPMPAMGATPTRDQAQTASPALKPTLF
jgi:hypothetical protein